MRDYCYRIILKSDIGDKSGLAPISTHTKLKSALAAARKYNRSPFTRAALDKSNPFVVFDCRRNLVFADDGEPLGQV